MNLYVPSQEREISNFEEAYYDLRDRYNELKTDYYVMKQKLDKLQKKYETAKCKTIV